MDPIGVKIVVSCEGLTGRYMRKTIGVSVSLLGEGEMKVSGGAASADPTGNRASYCGPLRAARARLYCGYRVSVGTSRTVTVARGNSLLLTFPPGVGEQTEQPKSQRYKCRWLGHGVYIYRAAFSRTKPEARQSDIAAACVYGDAWCSGFVDR